jgi:hypothetical protein
MDDVAMRGGLFEVNPGLAWAIIIGSLLLAIVVIAGYWKVFSKAGKPGWAVLVPIYNIIVMLEIAKKPLWWFFLLIIPFVNYIFIFVIFIEIAKRFGQSVGFGVGMVLFAPIFWPILGFGSAKYEDLKTSNSDVLDN